MFGKIQTALEATSKTTEGIAVILAIILVLFLFIVGVYVAMWLWNWLMTKFFHLPRIEFWEMAGMQLLIFLLF